MIQVQAGELISSLYQFQSEGFTGITDFEGIPTGSNAATMNRQPQLRYTFAFREGALTYIGKTIPSPLEFANWMKTRMQLTHMESTLKVVANRTKNQDSLRELLEFIARFGLIKWDELEAMMHKEMAAILERILPYPGTFKNKTSSDFDLSYGEDCHGLDLSKIRQVLGNRQQLWQSLNPKISLETVPILQSGAPIPTAIAPHLNKWATGQFSLAEIAGGCNEDPLQLAQAYAVWTQQGWLKLDNTDSVEATPIPTVVEHRPLILSVDDSKIVQTMISRSIGDLYDVKLAGNAVEALTILNTQKVELLLLDVTMPDIDGLELCRTIRAMPKFKQLPIIMLTAKDGLVDRVKGQFAGSTHYLTKPVDREKLLPVLEKYIPQAVGAK